MKKNNILIIIVFLIMLPVGVFAEDEPIGVETTGTITLSIEQARSLALANSRSLAKYNLTMQNNRLDDIAQVFSNLPSLSLGGPSASIGLWNAGGEGVNFPDSLSGNIISFGVSQKIFNGGKSIVLASINKISSEITRKEALAEYYAVLDAADTAYYNVLQSAVSLEAAESTLQTAAFALSVAEIRSANGMIKPGDYLQALAEKETRENARNQAKRDLALNSAKLKAITGIAELPVLETADFDAYETLISHLSEISDEKLDGLYADLWKAAAAGNPGLTRASLSSQIAKKNVTLAGRDYLPTLNAGFNLGGWGYSVQDGIKLSPGSFSLSGSIPLDFWVTANTVAKRKITLEQSNLDYLGAESSLELELQTTLLSLLSQAETVLSSRRACDYAEKHFEYVIELYRLGQNSVSELSDAAALVSSNRNQRIRAEFGFLGSLSKLRSLGAFASESDLMELLLS
ncbi:MAG: TolC family protein [Treponema sp.]|jgi:outer membrane protein TolC|nr:TolC family protein [Treponema sp.]